VIEGFWLLAARVLLGVTLLVAWLRMVMVSAFGSTLNVSVPLSKTPKFNAALWRL